MILKKGLIKILVMAFLTPVFSSQSFASIPKKVVDTEMETVIMALGLPLANRLKALSSKDESKLEVLNKIIFDKDQKLQIRWRAITTIGRIYPQKGLKTLERAFKSKEWFLRNAATIAIANSSRKAALWWAGKMLDDKALVVRTSAVQTIQKINGVELESTLWNKLYSSENFKRGHSLWIRKYIAEALAKFAHKGQENRFIKLLADQDKSVHRHAITALKKITRINPAEKAKSIKEQRKHWLSWWNNKG